MSLFLLGPARPETSTASWVSMMNANDTITEHSESNPRKHLCLSHKEPCPPEGPHEILGLQTRIFILSEMMKVGNDILIQKQWLDVTETNKHQSKGQQYTKPTCTFLLRINPSHVLPSAAPLTAETPKCGNPARLRDL